jgi:hypothetical protein
MSAPAFAQSPFFHAGNVVVAVSGCGVHGGTCTSVLNGTGNGTLNSSVGGYGDNQGTPLTLFQYTPNGTASVSYQNSLVLPQAGSGANLPVSAEYGSSSEGTLQLSGGNQYLSIMGYGIPAATFDASPFTYGSAPSGALAQSGSLTGQSYTPVARVVALIDANGNVNSATKLFNIFNNNNPRSIFTADGVNAYVSGQGNSDATGGVFYIPVGVETDTPTAITGLDTSSNTKSQDTRTVQIVNGTLYVSVDSKEGSGSNRDFIGTLGNPPATSLFASGAGPTQLTGFSASKAGKLTVSGGNGNNISGNGALVNISPVNFFFASPSVLYVADSGNPKNDSNGDTNSNGTANLGLGGLQKWVNTQTNGSGTWNLKYTLYQGLNIVNNGGTSGTTGLYGLAGTVSGTNVLLYATNAVLNDLDQTYLYGITDVLSNTTPPGTSLAFTQLEAAPADSNFKGVSLAPSIPNGSVEITTSPSGLQFTAAGTGCAAGSYTSPRTLSWTPGSSCTLSVTTPQSATGGPYNFAKWEDGSTGATHVVTAPSTTAVYSASFTTTPTITWNGPAAITFGSALSATQLNATAGVAGTFVYNPPAGTVLPVGTNQTLNVTFNPTDTAHFNSATASTTITVNPASTGGSPANLVVTRTLTRSGGNVNIQVTIANTGGTAAANVVLSSAKVGTTNATPLPQNLGTIAAGSSASVTVSVPGSVGAAGAASSITLGGTYTGGTFNSTARITLP